MKEKIVMLLWILTNSLFGGIFLDQSGTKIDVSGSFELEKIETQEIAAENYSQIEIKDCQNSLISGKLQLPIYSRLIALPAIGNYQCTKSDHEFDEIFLEHQLSPIDARSIDDEIFSQDKWFPEEIVKIGDPVVMAGNRFSQITISAVQYNPFQKKLRLIKNLDLEFELNNSDPINISQRKTSSRAFEKIMDQKVFGNNYRPETEHGQYLFIAPQSTVTTLQPLLRWKEKLGFQTHLETLEDIGYDPALIKAYLQNAYDNWETPPEFVVLVGDVTGNIQCPAEYVEGYLYPYCVTDHYYALLDGDDYFPDIFIGRLSVQDQIELMTIVAKIIRYESDPFTAIDWFDKALMVGYVETYNGFSQRETLLEIRDKLLNFEYTQVDTFIAPSQSGSTLLENMINEGQTMICYRGAGGPIYWSGGMSGPMFTVDNIPNLTNGYMLPVVHSMTCGGGDFAAGELQTCFGELWLAAGSPGAPKGAIGFIGPSERDTKTWFNNPNALGIYQGLTQEGLYRCGEMLLRGKMELYYAFPFSHDWGGAEDSDQFYFYVYNLLGDPGLQVWTHTPQEIAMTAPSSLPETANYLEVTLADSLSDPQGFTIALTAADGLISAKKTDDTGKAFIPIQLESGDYEITASKYGFIPETRDLRITEENIISMEDFSLENTLISGDETELNFSVKNNSNDDIENISLIFTSNEPSLWFPNPTIIIDQLSSAETFSDNIQINIGRFWQEEKAVNIFLEFVSDKIEQSFMIEGQIRSPELFITQISIDNPENSLIQNEEATMSLELVNNGFINSGEFVANLRCTNEKATISDNSANFADIAVDQIGVGNFTLAAENVISGEIAEFCLELTADDSLLQEIFFSKTIGIVDSTSPTFSDYGYFAIESEDVGNFESPIYNWIEIDPNSGGDGILLEIDHSTIDGYIGTIDLPFQFRYFGRYYHQVSICSEGYLAMGKTENIFHRNRQIPSGSGVAAMIAPFWDDLIEGDIYVKYDEIAHKMIIQWSDWCSKFDPTKIQTFQVILFDEEYYPTATNEGEILFQYKEIHNVDQEEYYATIGIENETQTAGLELSFYNVSPETMHSLKNETAILFTIKESNTLPFLTIDNDLLEVNGHPDSLYQVAFTLRNELQRQKEISYSIEISHFSRNGFPQRDIGSDFIICSSGNYIPIQPQDMNFYLVHDSPDGEAITNVELDFPDGFTINSASDLGALQFNGETGNGANVSWGNGITAIDPAAPLLFSVNITIDANMISPVDIYWQITGDGSGAAPHILNDSFTIFPTSDIYFWIRYPNGGENILPGTADSLVWDHYGEIDSVKIELTRDAGNSWDILADNFQNSGIFHYNVFGPLSQECRFRISTLDGEFTDISDSLFSISALNITYPTINSILSYSKKETLRWQDIGGLDEVDIELSTNDKLTWSSLAIDHPNTGEFVFNVPGPPSENCYFKIRNIDYSVEKFSDPFTIVDSPVDWIACGVASGKLESGESKEIELELNSYDLEVGTYTAYILIKSELGQHINIPLTLRLTEEIPSTFETKLYQNYPNPFNLSTTISFDLTTESTENTEIIIYNVKGQKIRTLPVTLSGVEELRMTKTWNGRDDNNKPVSSGIYFYQLNIGNEAIASSKCILLK